MESGQNLLERAREAVPEPAEGLFEPEDVVILLSSDRLGDGDPELGSLLMKNLFYALVESVTAPRGLVLLNRAVMLAGPGSPVLESLRALEKQGVGVLCCSTSLGHYGVRAQAGTPANMYRILEVVFEARKVVAL